MTSETTQNPKILAGRKLSAVKVGWWALFAVYFVFNVFLFWDDGKPIPEDNIERFNTLLYAIMTVTLWIMAIVVFAKKSCDWFIVPVTVLFFTLDTYAYAFLEWMLNQGWFGNLPSISKNLYVSTFSMPFDFFTYLVLLGVFLTFPTGQWFSRGSKRVFWIVTGVLTFFVLVSFLGLRTTDADLLNSDIWMVDQVGQTVILLLAGYIFLKRYRSSHNLVERQQMKWIVVFFSIRVWVQALDIFGQIFLGIYDAAAGQNYSSLYSEISRWVNFLYAISDFGLAIAFSISIFRYRLWDIEFLVNKTLVYSGLTAALGLVVVVSTSLINYAIKRLFGDGESSAWAIILSAVPVAAAFRPLQNLMQNWVDRYFKPEEINFSDYFVEFRADVREMLGVTRITQIVSRQVKKQLNVDFARIYLQDESDALHPISSSISEETAQLALDELTLSQLVDGQVVSGSENDSYSLLVPLVVTRPRYPDFLGVIILGCRLSGKGYSTQVLDNLKKLGEDAGQAIYLAQLSEQSKQKALA